MINRRTGKRAAATFSALFLLMAGAAGVSAAAASQAAEPAAAALAGAESETAEPAVAEPLTAASLTDETASSEMRGTDSQRLLIEEAGTYTLTGSMKGTVYVDPGEGDVTLILDNADIEGISEPAIMAVSGSSLTIELAEGTCNHLTDTVENSEQAAILTRVNTIFRGCGCLQTEGSRKYGILAENADLTFACGKYLFLSEEAGIVLDGPEAGTLYLNGGCVFINAKTAPYIAAERIVKKAGMLEETKKTDVRAIDCCREGDCLGCCCSKKCARAALVPVCVKCEKRKCECRTSATDHPGPITEGIVSNEAVSLQKDEEAVTIRFEKTGQHPEITEPGTYCITGTTGDGSITVAKNTKGVILVLKDLNLTSMTGAALTIGSSAVVKIIVEGSVHLADSAGKTDTSASGDSAPQAVTAVVQGDAGSEVCITGTGSLKIEGKSGDGIAMGQSSSLVVNGDVNMQIQAAGDGIRSENDVAILSGTQDIQAGNHGIRADHIVTVGQPDGSGPDLQISNSNEGIDADVINIKGGSVTIDAAADGIDAENRENGTEPSVNITGGSLDIHAGENGIDSNGNVNLISGTAVIDSKDECGACTCIDVDEDLYISEDFTLDCGCEDESAESDCQQVSVCAENPVPSPEAVCSEADAGAGTGSTETDAGTGSGSSNSDGAVSAGTTDDSGSSADQANE